MASKAFDLATSPGHLLRRCQQYAADIYSEEIGGAGVTPRQYAVLHTVENNEGASQTELVRLTGIDRSTLADMIQRLIAKDLLARKRTEEDQRANAVRLTASGRKAIRAVQTAVERAEKRILDPVPASKRTELVRLLTVIAEAADARDQGEELPKAKKPVRKRAR